MTLGGVETTMMVSRFDATIDMHRARTQWPWLEITLGIVK